MAVNVYDAGDGLVGSFGTIQAAVDAAANGYRVEIEAGTYVEQVSIDGFTGLEVVGLGTVNIVSPATLSASGTDLFTGNDVYSVVTVSSSTGVEISNVTVDGAGTGGGVAAAGTDFVGVFFLDASGSLDGVTVDSVRDALVGGQLAADDRGHGVLVSSIVPATAVSITNSTFTDFQDAAIVANNVDLTVDNNTITGGGTQDVQDQSGVVMANGATGSITNNDISEFGFSDTLVSGDMASGVLVSGAGAVSVTGNTIIGSTSANNIGVDLSTTSGSLVRDNAILFVDVGVADTGNTGAGNTIDNLSGLANSYALIGDVAIEFEGGGAVARSVYGTTIADRLTGGTGDDSLFGLDGDDTLSGGDGADRLYGAVGADTLNGGAGNDLVRGDGNADTLNGDAGNDRLYGGTGDDVLNGGDDADLLIGGDGIDQLDGGAGNDRVFVDASDSSFVGGTGFDTLVVQGSTGVSVDLAATSFERAYGSTGGDSLNGSSATSSLTLVGNDGNDVLRGGSGADRLYGGVGNDQLFGNGGLDSLVGGLGTDTLTAGNDGSTLYGDDGNDTLNGGAGFDRLYGGTGSDIFNGGGGNDYLFVDVNDLQANIDAGSGTDDRIYLQGSGNYTLDLGTVNAERYYGNDDIDTVTAATSATGVKIYTNGGADDIIGSAFDDIIVSGAGDDTIFGGAGDDRIDGGDGIDTLVLNGFSGLFTLTFGNPGEVQITSLLDGAVDLVSSMEFLQFDDLIIPV